MISLWNGNDKQKMNRSFKFGDGLFETMRWHAGKIFNLDLHTTRLRNGLSVLGIEAPKGFDAAYLEKIIAQEIDQKNKNADSPNWRVRISCFRAGEGLYTPERNEMEYLIEASPLSSEGFYLNENGINLGIYEEVVLNYDVLSPLKTTSALPYVMAARYRQSRTEIDDCLLLNTDGRIAETIAANLFYRVGDQIYTPKITEACVAGTMRQWVLNNAESIGLKATETEIRIDDLAQAEEIFLTNAIQGIRWVECLDWNSGLLFSNCSSKSFIKILNRALSQIDRRI